MPYMKLSRPLPWVLLMGYMVLVLCASVAEAASLSHILAIPPLPSRTEVFTGQGFDTCEVPTVAALEAWFVASPYRAVNLYIGGAGRYCSNQALNADLVARLGQIGWRFIPTWVGPQAPCYTGRKPLMSWDPATAQAQGIAEAAAAIKVAADLGLAAADGSGTIIYYDLEHYDSSDSACHEPVAAFISGWVGELQAAGNLAGVYGNPAPLVSFAALPNVPDAIWPARWLYTAYNPNVTVWDVPNVPADLWTDHQRIWQYAGGHNETWHAADANLGLRRQDAALDQSHSVEMLNMIGPSAWAARFGHEETWNGVTLNIDCNVIDGIVARWLPGSLRRIGYLPMVIVAGAP